MITFETDVCSGDLAVEIFHGGFGGQDTIFSNQPDNLTPERNERDEVNNCEGAKKQPANDNMLRRFDVFSPKALGDGGEESAMSGDKTVGAFGTSSEYLGMNLPVEEPLFARIVGERAKAASAPV